MKGTLVLFGSVVVGNYLAERFVLKNGPDDPTGFVVVSDGLGMDDVARAVAILGVAFLGRKFLG